VHEEKLVMLLKKQENKYALIDDIIGEVIEFLQENEISYTQKETGEPFKILDLNSNVLLCVVDDYKIFNKKVLPKKYVEQFHFSKVKLGYRVIWVKKFEWEDLRKRNVLQSLILHALGKTKNHIFARKTYAEVIPSKDLRDFFNLSSFYGYRNASFAVCLRDKKTDEILMAMNFGHPYYGKNRYGSNAVECIRAASKPHTLVVGGMSKLMKFMLKQFGSTFDSIVYYIDSSHYGSGSMGSAGFTYSHFAGDASHNIWVHTGAMMMRTPALHQEIMYMIRIGEIAAIPDVGNETFIWKK
jgi:hypothetical protein